MEIKKPNDILVATLSNPELTPYDLLSHNITGENTSLLPKEEYKNSTFIQDKFKDDDGNFDNVAFEEVYKLAQNKYQNLTDEEYLSELDKMEYSPFDITRPKFAKTFNVSTQIEKEYNPFEVRKGWSGFGSINESPLSLREIAQKNKIYDPDTDTWSEQSVNDLSLYDKLIGDTLVYGQYDEDGMHFDKQIGSMVKHKKGDWKVDDNGNLFLEKLGNRSVYGKQVLNPMDTLTTDGSLMNQYDFFGVVPALDACEALGELLHAVIAGEYLEKSVRVSQISLTTVVSLLETENDREFSPDELKDNELIEGELDLQWQIYRLLRDCEERDIALINELRNELRTEGISNIGIKNNQ